ncbi:antibiotic biosynthesis monooxygenase [Luteimonas sp. Y-2-2-4F]|nr:antibiotic biosynthesis monooxygenase family protein [Luteimonas sp. Y-2-2-4F]MCD9033597.1 antibiotic biosynthesis monooxygenase [Luteimonas sp. Y-2-2-4F]
MTGHRTATIDPGASCATLVNLYEVDPDRQAELVGLLSDLTRRSIRHRPGFVSVSVHSSLDGTRVVNYAQWASPAHFEAFMRQPATQEQLRSLAAVARRVSPALYRVDAVHAR